MTPFDGKYQNLLTSFFYFIFANVRPVQKKVPDTQTDIHTEIDKATAIGKILQICLKQTYIGCIYEISNTRFDWSWIVSRDI